MPWGMNLFARGQLSLVALLSAAQRERPTDFRKEGRHYSLNDERGATNENVTLNTQRKNLKAQN